jgi:hypothetical protein
MKLSRPRFSRKSKSARVAYPKLTSAWEQFAAALNEYRRNFGLYFKITAIVAIPLNALALFFATSDPYGNTSDPLSGFSLPAAIVMNAALLWVVMYRHDTGRRPTLAQAYYDGTANFMRYVLACIFIALMCIPAALGARVYGVGVLSPLAAGASAVELSLLSLVSLLLTIPTLYLVVRHILAPFAAMREGLRPLAALRWSRALTKGRFWAVAQRLALLAIFLAIISIPATFITLVLAYAGQEMLGTVLFVVLTTIIALPLFYIYVDKLYLNLEDTRPGGHAPETAAKLKPAETAA